MSSKPTVTLTFAGDSAKLEQAMSRVGESSRQMGDQVGHASRSMQDSGKRADELAEKTDTLDTRSMGFRDTITGLQDGFKGLTDSSLSTQDRLLMLGMGVGDLASGFTNFLIPAIANTRIGMMLITGATRLWAVAQQMLNLSFWVSPIGLIVLGIVALIAIVVLIATKTDWFQRLWRVAWAAIKAHAVDVWEWLSGLPGRIGSAFASLANIISAPYRAGFNMIARAWNSTVGRLSWTVPGWVPGLGGHSVSAPRLPTFHTGGIVPGMPGQEVLALLRAGERVTPAGQGGGAMVMTFAGDLDSAMATAIMYLVRSGHIDLRQT